MKYKLKSVWVPLLALLLALCACGCGSRGADSSSSEPESEASSAPAVGEETETVLAFAGDINLDDEWYVMKDLRERGGRDISQAIDPLLIQRMRDADLCCINNEFTFSNRGEPMDGKTYTFRSAPANVSVLQDLGVDVVTLANNHIYDYGTDAFLDTLTTLSDANIDYVGAGKNLAEAMTPRYYELNGLTVAVVNATRAEKNIMTPEAEETTPGVLRCYDTALFEQVIREADARADVVVCCVHWGTEYSYSLEWVQRDTAKTYIDAGADIIVGTHAHCLQGIEFYNDVPVFYNLGNYWFNEKELRTCLLEITLTGKKGDWNLSTRVVPALQKDCKTTELSGEEAEALYDELVSHSINAAIQPDGTVYESREE